MKTQQLNKIVGKEKRRLTKFYKDLAMDTLIDVYGEDLAYTELPQLMADVEHSEILADYVYAYSEWTNDPLDKVRIHCENILADHVDKYAI